MSSKSYKGKKRKRNQRGTHSVLLSEMPQLVEDSESEDDDDDDESENEDDNLETHPPKKSNIEPEKEKETPMDIAPIEVSFKCQKCTYGSIHRKEFEEHIRTAHQVENAFK